MSGLLERTAFSVRGLAYSWGDVVLGAEARGDWSTLADEVREGLACRLHAAEVGLSLPPGEPAQSSQEFRYARDLLTAQQAEDWLTLHEITVREWSDYFRRTLFRQLLAFDAKRLAAAATMDAEELSRATLVHAICSGSLDRFAHVLAGQLAAQETLPPMDAGNRKAFFVALNEQFEHFRSRAITERKVRDVIAAHRMEWTRVECRLALFDERGAANEAAMCVREDDLDLAQVAAEADVDLETGEQFIEEMPESVRDLVRAARAGDLVGPIHVDGQWALYDVRAKELPTDADAWARGRAEAGVLARALEPLTREHVRWASLSQPG